MFDMRYYTSVLLRRSPLLIVVTGVCAVLSVLVARELPAKYEASARLLVESAQIPDQLAMSTATTGAQEQLEIIQQRLLTRANLLDIANRFEVFPDIRSMSPDEVVRSMRSNTRINLTSGRDRATLMTISFTDDRPVTTSDVVNEYITLIQREDSRLRTSRASETEQFFKQEVDRLAVQLDEKSAAIRQFRSENSDALPETFEFRLERLAGLQERSTAFTRDLLILKEQRQQLKEALDGLRTGLPEDATEELSQEEEKLVDLRRELVEAMETAGETAPRVRILQSRIAQVERVIQSLGGITAIENPTQTLQAQIEQINAQIGFLEEQLGTTQSQIEDVEATLDLTPGISVSLESLQRDYQNVQEQYNSAVERLAIAQTSERIELASRGQRIIVLEQAATPTDPSSMPPLLVAAGGTIGGFFLALGLAILLEVMSKTIRRPSDLTKGLGIVPLATLPYVKTSREIVFERVAKVAIILVIVTGIPAMLYAVHMLYLPLDLLADRILTRIGV
ncbi:polysaccharide chain length determinant protein [Dinoroseobacter shibae DFL 12 = DSM 16493]|jgi:uncharacterized protein involved in exopolysaccharide biosynthesis|uniref:Polysaccharide chain length determinant protein n=1 Tax=Dinoroseobacter shibae (strain DSM 16493 / NCIMB 14021 / DFL 12) TaxID=398580 RepID=A8LNM7_DINSH|nr:MULTISPECIES: Wzz/FepE/Etk N-terminal domain-containing protein [Dinoroseobacter]ABV95121.1 polysaccharide chain length determinant protein [Dinoroseobacter shibae DFL 12 = DSM 16493]MDD9718158.1 lipopolysaccharide biosynthesis [Dinoroseobacter sp. PD6]URF46535.1 lipopolysaccharide biosynthesis [Dinoroseobacter shibae]URF50841.1 lipopolysaccharide biosynthesis [Dinoroseobacter shibae]